jgi:hypothetical protein
MQLPVRAAVPAACRIALVALAAGSALAAGPALAAEFPAPKVMSDAPPDRGKWRMEMVQADGFDASAMQKQLGSDVTVCMTAAEAVARRDSGRQKCDTRLVEDTPALAIVEVSCPGTPPVRTRSTITREGDRTYLIATDAQGADGPMRMKMRMTYSGTCGAGDSVVSLGKDSQVCRDARAKIASGEAARQCASAGADQAKCEATLAAAKARIESLCK